MNAEEELSLRARLVRLTIFGKGRSKNRSLTLLSPLSLSSIMDGLRGDFVVTSEDALERKVL